MNDDFCMRLRLLRKQKYPIKGVSLTSQLIGLGKDTLRKYEQGEAMPAADALAMIADYYHVSMDYLWGRTNY